MTKQRPESQSQIQNAAADKQLEKNLEMQEAWEYFRSKLYREPEIDKEIDREKAALSDAIISVELYIKPEWIKKIDPRASKQS